ncbi:hypothetical protein [Microcystis aeruginosa]|uniref:Uncharacterized protein n=1 Tax=Microcystis aeruginosa PCC 9808 TaxID=1160284 RepID=I4HX68_MICAE|nr:hypothetical protein [Microcystis aeruginosa]CCI26642.1 hypothetical protein MICAG_3180006 [Microcystis aeruginosa PCC 9808]
MDSNFSFLRDQFPTIYDHASQAEGLVFSNPRASCFYTRFVLSSHAKLITCPIELKPLRGNDRHV